MNPSYSANKAVSKYYLIVLIAHDLREQNSRKESNQIQYIDKLTAFKIEV